MTYQTKISSLDHQGKGMTKINNKITFIPKTIPDDIVEVEIIKEHKNYQEGKLIKIITKSKDRKNYHCPYYDKCGGCHIASLSYNMQLEYKQDKVKNILNRYNKIDINPIIIPSENTFNYRNKVSLKVENNKLCYNEEKSNNLIPINNCLLISNKMNEIINVIEKNLDIFKITNIIIRQINNQLMLKFIGTIKVEDLINTLKDKVKSIYLNDKLIYGEKDLIETLNNYNFYISPDSFFQINIPQTINLYNQILAYANPTKEDKILDLYCGTGTIGIYLAKHAKDVLGIEINPSSIKNANKNKDLNNIDNITFKLGDVSKVLDTNYKADIIIVDPPRSGLDKKTINTILTLSPKKIVYVSCNPITFSRDLELLKEIYELKDIKLFDMFPQTYHVECVSLLEIKRGNLYENNNLFN